MYLRIFFYEISGKKVRYGMVPRFKLFLQQKRLGPWYRLHRYVNINSSTAS